MWKCAIFSLSMNPSEIKEFGIPRENEERRDGGCAVVFDPETQKYAVAIDDKGCIRLFSGGVDEGEDIQEGIMREVREEGGLHDFLYIEKIAEAMTHYHNTLKNVNRVAHAVCYLVILKSANLIPVKLEAHEKFTLVWASAEEIIQNWNERNQNEDYSHWIWFMEKSIARARELGYDKVTV